MMNVTMSKYSVIIMNFIEFPVFIIAGLGFSTASLPSFLQVITKFFPFGYIAELFRIKLHISTFLEFELIKDISFPLIGGLIIIIILLILLLYRIMENRMLKKGVIA